MYVYCDFCKVGFEINLQQEVIGKDENGDNIVLHYFTCPNCNHRYNSFVTDSIYDEMRSKYKKLIDKAYTLQGRTNKKVVEISLKKAKEYKSSTLLPYKVKLDKLMESFAAGKEKNN